MDMPRAFTNNTVQIVYYTCHNGKPTYCDVARNVFDKEEGEHQTLKPTFSKGRERK